MNFFEKIKSLFSGRISDEEVESNEWLLCPKCSVNIMKNDLISNEWVCPNCNCHMEEDRISDENFVGIPDMRLNTLIFIPKKWAGIFILILKILTTLGLLLLIYTLIE